ncbi:MAG: phenylalanine--tRNA ligase subunit alpha, partial [Deltaproteobacteria bacterium]|nr:phenylalanine--tRNA ligase subunit alpha [Deltaproteobacteria bacterium]
MIKQNLNTMGQSFQSEIEKATNIDEIDNIKVKYLGKKGKLADLMKQLKSLDKEEKIEIGKQANLFKTQFQDQIKEKSKQLKRVKFDQQMENEWVDITLDPIKTQMGSLHPITMVQNKLEYIFESMGFQVLDGPHIES